MSLSSFFGHIGHAFSKASAVEQVATSIAASAVGAFNPGLGSLVEMVGNAIYSAQSASPTTPGTAKKAQVQHMLDVSTPVTLELLSRIAGKTVEHPETVAPALDSLIDSLVTLFHAIGVFQAQTATLPPTPSASVSPAAKST